MSCGFFFVGLSGLARPKPQLNVNQQPNEESNELTEQDLLGTIRNRVPPQQTAPGPSKDLASVDFSDGPTPDPALADAYRRQNRTVPPPAPASTNWEAAITDDQSRQPKPTIPNSRSEGGSPTGKVVNHFLSVPRRLSSQALNAQSLPSRESAAGACRKG
jgi:hypothetical protein